MATGKSSHLSHSVLNASEEDVVNNASEEFIDASEEFIENPCSICISRGKNDVESTNYCVECDSNMCNGCTAWHTNFPSMMSHKVVRISTVSLKLRGEYNVRTASDESRCDITGACLMPDASVIIADNYNSSLKQLDSSYKVIRSLDITEPYDVCYTGINKVAVTQPDKETVRFVCVGASLKKTQSFSVGEECWGITCSDGELFVCCGKHLKPTTHNVRVFNLAGTHLRTIQHDPNGRLLFSTIRMVTVSSCGNRLYMTDWDKGVITIDRDWDKGVITIDRSGNLQQQLQDKALDFAHGICTLDNGDLLVSGHNSHNVLHVSRDGRKLAVVLGGDGLANPLALVFNPISSRLIVTTSYCDTIKVYDVTVM